MFAALIPLISAVVGLGASAYGAYSDYQAGQANEKRIKAETAEEARRMEMEQSREVGLAKAKAAASGTGMGGSQGMFISELESAREAELDWLKRSGTSRARAAAKEGVSSAITGLGAGIASATGTLASSDAAMSQVEDWTGWGG